MGTKKPVQKLRKSKKYAIGAEHETGGGRIRILDRFIQDGEIMLRYMNLDTRQDVINKEVNVNRLVYDYQQKKKVEAFEGIAEKSAETLPDTTGLILDTNVILELVATKEKEIGSLREEISSLKDEITSLRGEVATISENSSELIKKQFALIEKLVGK
ncbi:TPA: hypothetical protein ROY17_002045 [Bacillus thuringiensis]|nr:hypothetical protein [Bacillus thuringiensis]